MNESNIIVFDNLVRPSDIVGSYESITGKAPSSFVSSNAAGMPPSVDSLSAISVLASNSAQNIKLAFAV